jgi:peptidoglycan/xylan/chitin deacetylase (PgdA/CDA1 family)
MSHHDLTQLSDMELKAELEKSKKSIEDNIGTEVTMLAAPLGRIDDRVVDSALEAGYVVIMTSFTGINTDIDDLKYLKRFQIKSDRRSLRVYRYFSPISGVRLIGTAKNIAKKIRRKMSR